MSATDLAGVDLPEIRLVKKWLVEKEVKKRKTINKKMSSYGLKHVVERWAGEYVSNDSLIEAFRLAGFEAEKCNYNSPNFFFNISIPKENLNAKVK